MTALAASRPSSDLAVRTVAGVAMALVAMAALVWGDTPLWALVSAASLIMLREYGSLIGVEGWRRLAAMVLLAAALVTAQSHLHFGPFLPAAAIGAAVLIAIPIGGIPIALGIAYAGLPALSLFFLRGQYDGINLSLWALLVVWTTDIGAYFAGRAIGGAKLAPRISPNKTWAGLIGGITAALIVSLVLAPLLHVPLRLASLAGLLALAAQGGDLFESWLKRRAGVKDSGSILPGHGGVLDRLDGAIPVLVIVAALLLVGYV